MAFILAILSCALAALTLIKPLRIAPLFGLAIYFFVIDYANSLFRPEDSFLGYLSKSYKEIFFAVIIIYFALLSVRRRLLNLPLAILCTLLLWSLAYGAARHGFLASFLDWRDSAMPIAIAMLAVQAKIVDTGKFTKLMWLVLCLTVGNSLIAAYEYFTFDGMAQSSWRYDFLVEARQNNISSTDERFAAYQIVRNGRLRASGLLASALQFSYLAAMCAFFAVVQIRARIRGFQVRQPLLVCLCLLALPVLAAGMYVSQVRSTAVIFVVSLLVYLLTNLARPRITRLRVFAVISACYIATVALLTISGASFLDDSALGRVPQYATLLNEWSVAGDGLGAYRGQFDSLFVYGFLTYGLPFFIVLSALFTAIFTLAARYPSNPTELHFLKFTLPTLTAAAVVASSQHLSGSLYYQLVWFGVFLALSEVETLHDRLDVPRGLVHASARASYAAPLLSRRGE